MNTCFKRTDVRVRREPFLMNQLDILLYMVEQKDGVRSAARANPITFTNLNPADDITVRPEPTFSLEPEAAQQLMDELWRAGLRPTEGSGSTGQLASTLKHLEDMRSLVFKKEPKP